MVELENKIKMINLIDCYGNILTEKQLAVCRSYFVFDNSLAEIAEEMKISRQGVYDALSKGLHSLEKAEKSLGVCEKMNVLKTELVSFQTTLTSNDAKSLQKIIDKL